MNADLAREAYQAIRDLPKSARGRKFARRASVSTASLDMAARFVDIIQLDELIEGWRCEDHPNRVRKVGRPETLSTRAYLIVTLACADSGVPISLAQVHHTLVEPAMPRAIRRALGFDVDSSDPARDAFLDRRRTSIGYDCVTRVAQKVAVTFDPRPFPARRGLEKSEIESVERSRDPEGVIERQRRADHLQALMPYGTYLMIPKDVRPNWTGDITLDATVIPVFGQDGHGARSRKSKTSQSPEVNAGLHIKTADKRNATDHGATTKADEIVFGYHAHLGLMTGGPDDAPFPRLIAGVSLDRPSMDPGLNAATLLAGVRRMGHPAGILTTDLGYSQQYAHNYALPARDLGYGLMHMFKSTNLGIQTDGEYTGPPNLSGFQCVEGTLYGPCMPQRLVNATIDYQIHQTITEAEYEARIEARRAYQARLKSNPDGSLSAVFRCPGAGVGRTVRCNLKPVSASQEKKEITGGRPMLPLIIDTPEAPPKCCTNAASVSIPKDWAARFLTEMPYKTPEWNAYYRSARNRMEGVNGELKSALEQDIASAGLRRYRGFGKQLLALMVKVVIYNLGVLANWVDQTDAETGAPPRNRGGRPATPRREQSSADPNAPPLRIINTPKEGRAA